MDRITFFTLISSFTVHSLANAVIPRDAQITPAPLLPRQNDARFIGYLSTNGSYSTEFCNAGLTWYQSGSYAQCCATSLASCIAPTACVSGTQIYPWSGSSTRIACTSNYGNPLWSVCNTYRIYENTADSNPHTDIVCGAGALDWSIYRSLPSTTSSTSTSKSSSSSAESTTIPPTPTPTPEQKSSSKAWIAGAVAGPVVGLALLGALIFFLLRKKSKPAPQSDNQQQAQPTMTESKPAYPPYQGQQQHPHEFGQQGQWPQARYPSTAPTSPSPAYEPWHTPPPQGGAVEIAGAAAGSDKKAGVTSKYVQEPSQAAELSGQPWS